MKPEGSLPRLQGLSTSPYYEPDEFNPQRDYKVLEVVKYSSPATRREGAWGRGGIAPTHSRPRHYMGVSGQRHTPAALYPRGKDPRYPLNRRLGGPQNRSGRRGRKKNPLPLPGI
jgi:hypothetical protein